MTVERILALGAEHGFPAVRLQRGDVLQPGEAAWRRHTATLTPEQHARLADALRMGWAQNLVDRGMVRST